MRRLIVATVAVTLVVAGCAQGRVGVTADLISPSPSASPVASARSTPTTAPAPTVPPDFAAGRSFIVDDYPDFVAATVGGASLRIPSGENLVAVSGDRAATLIYRDARGIRGAGGATIIVREISSGRELVRVDRPEHVATMVFAGGSLYFAGAELDDGMRDTGVGVIDLADGSVREVVAAGPWPGAWIEIDLPAQYAEFKGTGSRWQLRVSPTGRTVGSSACGPAIPGGGAADHCFIDVIDVGSDTVSRPVTDTPLHLWAMSDTTLYARTEGRGAVSAFDRGTGDVRWQSGNGEFPDSYVTSGGTLIAAWIPATTAGPRSRTGIAEFDGATGALRMIYEVSTDLGLAFWPELSDDRYAVVARRDPLRYAFGQAQSSVSADLVELATGTVFPDALTIPSPIAR